MFYESTYRADVGDFSQLETASRAGVTGANRSGGPRQGENGWMSGREDASSRPRLLSAAEAAEQIGVSESRLREINDFHWELVGMGCHPFGPSPVRLGSQCFYSMETLEHWFGDPA